MNQYKKSIEEFGPKLCLKENAVETNYFLQPLYNKLISAIIPLVLLQPFCHKLLCKVALTLKIRLTHQFSFCFHLVSIKSRSNSMCWKDATSHTRLQQTSAWFCPSTILQIFRTSWDMQVHGLLQKKQIYLKNKENKKIAECTYLRELTLPYHRCIHNFQTHTNTKTSLIRKLGNHTELYCLN